MYQWKTLTPEAIKRIATLDTSKYRVVYWHGENKTIYKIVRQRKSR